MPIDLINETYSPKIELVSLDDKIYIVNTSEKYKDIIPIGSEIIKVNKEISSEYIKKNLFPFISASTTHIKQKIAVQDLLASPINKNVLIEFKKPNSSMETFEFSNLDDNTSWIKNSPDMQPIEFKMLNDNISYLKINTFGDKKIVDKFKGFTDSIKKSKKLIIDLRENGGGNAEYGYEILKYFSSKPFLTSKWMTREHKAAYKAWGEAESWHIGLPDTIVPYYDKYIPISIVILIGNNTASASEDFLVASDNIGLLETVGDYTYGSTGQPLNIKLPGGGSGRICTKKDTYPDGREFVGYGIKPKYVVKQSLQDILNQHDVVLEHAINLKLH